MSYVSSLRMTERHTSNLGHQFLLRTHSTILCEHRDNDKKMHVLHLLPHDEKTENGVTRCVLSTLSYLSSLAGQIKIRLVYAWKKMKIRSVADTLLLVTKQYPHVLSLPNLTDSFS